MKKYIPAPVETKNVILPVELEELSDKIAENVHEVWAQSRLSQGWTYGPVRDDAKKQTPCMVPYTELTEEEKAYDKDTAFETIRLIVKLGYTIIPPTERR